MALKQKINDDLKAALLSGDHFVVEVLRGLKAVILNEEVAKGLRDEGLDDTVIEQLIAREVKKRNESAELYDQAGRSELAATERREAAAMVEYLPKQLSEAEISAVVERIVNEIGATGPSMMGQVIGAVKKELGNSADGSLIAKIVKSSLI
ncbi:GatB/YqeY domain-containing protein [Candidatus Saccharibacteria bacterium]|nr:GatB/YqeY domain-containing protein [Candidatus Saccharibacteria bacterium]